MTGRERHKRAGHIRLAVAAVLTALALVALMAACSPAGPASDGRYSPGLEAGVTTPPAERGQSEGGSAEETALPPTTTVPLAPTPIPAPGEKGTSAGSLGIVAIDAGHQAKGDSSLEPIGPGAAEKKPRVTSGTAGVATRVPESEITLAVALKLRDQLQARGVTVVMVRTTQDVNISNSERAQVANEAGADLVIRLHCDGSEDRARTGLSTLVPGRNQWTGPIVAESAVAGRSVHAAVIDATGAVDRGVVQRTDLSGFNWSKVPSVLVEMGFMSNAAEDRRLSTAAYQESLARGMADGAVSYLRGR